MAIIKFTRQCFRIIHINYVLIKHGLDKVVLSIPLFRPIQFLSYLNPWHWFGKDDRTHGERIRNALEELGPIFVKFGQMLSTRGDILPEDIALELSKLQDRVPPFDSQKAVSIIEQALGQPVTELFAEFHPDAMASASIAQVHAAIMHDGTDVVVKVLRPNIEKQIQRDVELMHLLARLAENYWSEGKRLHPVDIVKEFERNIIDELDLVREAANASQLRRNFKNSDALYVPEVYWDYVRDNVMVIERIKGIPISDIDALERHGMNMKKLAENGVEIFFTQVFRDGFFHADMHPGNIFVDPDITDNPRYLAVDFGIVGTLNPSDQRYLAENMLAFFKRDYRRVAQLHIDSGWVPSYTRVDEFESAIRTVCEPIFEKPLKDISFGRLLLRLFQTGRRFNMEVQPQLVLLQKTLLNIEGLGRRLYPELNLWETAKPLLEDWLKHQLSPFKAMSSFKEKIPYWTEKFPEIPGLLYNVLEHHQQSHTQQELEFFTRKYTKRRGYGFWQGLGIGLLLTAVLNTLWFSHKLQSHMVFVLTSGLSIVAIISFIIAWAKNRER